MAIAVLKNRLFKHRAAARRTHQRHHDRLRIRGKARIRKRLDRSCARRPCRRAKFDTLRQIQLTAAGLQHREHRCNMCRNRVWQADMAARRRSSTKPGNRRNAVRHDGIFAFFERCIACNFDDRRTGSGYMRARRTQKFLQIDDLRFHCCVYNARCAPARRRCKHDVLCRAHAWKGQRDLRCARRFRHAGDAAGMRIDLIPHLSERDEMQVDRPGAQLAPAGKGQLRRRAPRQNRPEEDDRRAHPPHQLLGHGVADNIARVDDERVPLARYRASKLG